MKAGSSAPTMISSIETRSSYYMAKLGDRGRNDERPVPRSSRWPGPSMPGPGLPLIGLFDDELFLLRQRRHRLIAQVQMLLHQLRRGQRQPLIEGDVGVV